MLSNSVGEEGRASSNKQHEDLTFTTAEQNTLTGMSANEMIKADSIQKLEGDENFEDFNLFDSQIRVYHIIMLLYL